MRDYCSGVLTDALVLATDPDREGEAIAWQVLDWLEARDAIGERPVIAYRAGLQPRLGRGAARVRRAYRLVRALLRGDAARKRGRRRPARARGRAAPDGAAVTTGNDSMKRRSSMKRSRAVPPVADPSPEAAALAGRRAGKSLREIAVELYGWEQVEAFRYSGTRQDPPLGTEYTRASFPERYRPELRNNSRRLRP